MSSFPSLTDNVWADRSQTNTPNPILQNEYQQRIQNQSTPFTNNIINESAFDIYKQDHNSFRNSQENSREFGEKDRLLSPDSFEDRASPLLIPAADEFRDSMETASPNSQSSKYNSFMSSWQGRRNRWTKSLFSSEHRYRRVPKHDSHPEFSEGGGHGKRVWYGDWSTIDWIHDHVKERRRLRHLRSLRGIQGRLKQMADASQAWIMVTVIGILCGLIASAISVSSDWLGDIKEGFCTDGFWKHRHACCTSNDTCTAWRSYSTAIKIHNKPWNILFDFSTFLFLGCLFSVLSAISIMPTRVNAPTQYTPPTYLASSSGIPELKVILSGFIIRRYLGIRNLICKSIGIVLAVGGGLNVGIQGPLVLVAACIGNVIARIGGKFKNNEAKRRELITASTAAGVAVAFGAPLGGILFSLEEISYYFGAKTLWRSFLCALVAAATVQWLNPWGGGKVVMFAVEYNDNWKTFELAFIIILAIIGGLYGALFISLNTKYRKLRISTVLGFHPIREIFFLSIVTLLVSFWTPFTRESGDELLAQLFHRCKDKNDQNWLCQGTTLNTLIVLGIGVLIRAGLTVATFGSVVPAGVFIPTMAVGAGIGRIMGICINLLIKRFSYHPIFNVCPTEGDCVTPGIYAMMGAAATVSGVTRMTVSLVVIIFELTGTPQYILPLMLSVLVSKFISSAVCFDGIYDRIIALNGYPYLDHKREWKGVDYDDTGAITSIMDRYWNGEVLAFECGKLYEISEIEEKMQHQMAARPDSGFPILERGYLIGYIAYNELEHAIELAKENPSPYPPCIFHRYPTPSSSTSLPNQLITDSPLLSSIATPDTIGTRSIMNPTGYASNDTLPSTGPISSSSTRPLPQQQQLQPYIIDLSPWMDRSPFMVNDEASIELIREIFVKIGVKYICVVKDGEFLGIVDKRKVIQLSSQH